MSNPGVPQPDQIPVPDTSDLPDQSAPNQFAMENANQAMSPQVAPPAGPTANPGALKGLLTNFFGGMGRAMMTHAGLPTPEEEQQRSQQLAMKQQLDQSTIQYHKALSDNLKSQNEEISIPQPPAPDGTPVPPLVIPRRYSGQAAIQQLKNDASKGPKMVPIPPEFAAQHPELQGITQIPEALLPYVMPKVANTAGKPPKIQYDQGIPVSVTDPQGTVYDVNDPNLPNELKPLTQSALNAHKQHVREQADIQASAFGRQVKMNEIKQGNLTNSTKTMIEAAPKVISFVDRIDKLVDAQKDQLGPAAGRWNEFMTGKVGAPNPEFTKLRTDVGLMTTLLMRMHVGARGGEYIMKHFQDLVDSGKQSPENLKAAMSEIRQYAQDVQAEAPTNSPAAASSGTIRVKLPDGRTGTAPASSRKKYEDMGAKILP